MIPATLFPVHFRRGTLLFGAGRRQGLLRERGMLLNIMVIGGLFSGAESVYLTIKKDTKRHEETR